MRFTSKSHPHEKYTTEFLFFPKKPWHLSRQCLYSGKKMFFKTKFQKKSFSFPFEELVETWLAHLIEGQQSEQGTLLSLSVLDATV